MRSNTALDPVAQGGIGRHEQDTARAEQQNQDIEHEAPRIRYFEIWLARGSIKMLCASEVFGIKKV
jgi:hypothetical protein